MKRRCRGRERGRRRSNRGKGDAKTERGEVKGSLKKLKRRVDPSTHFGNVMANLFSLNGKTHKNLLSVWFLQ